VAGAEKIMKALIVGLGSMGKRRVRCLKALGYEDILGYELREDRRAEAEKLYQIKTTGTLDSATLNKIDVMIISTPPDKHNQYINLAIENKKPAFVEASVILAGLRELDEQARKNNVFIAPSCTLRFHPAIKDIKNIVAGGKYGKVTNFNYHSGQYLPDWHPWEMVKDFYVGNKETGGCREIIPFELTWLIDIVGFPGKVTSLYGKTMDVGADIDDSYMIAMDFGGSFGVMTVDVVSRYALRSLILNMERGQILWRWDETVVKLYEAANKRWINYNYPQGQAAGGYNVNISENMYIEELGAFIKAATENGQFPNSLDEDIRILEILNRLEGR
jgi:predicted dehydrogenase